MPANAQEYDFPALVEGLYRYLRLRTIPIGMKRFETVEEMEAIPKIRRPKARLATDQVVAQARQLGWTVGGDHGRSARGAVRRRGGAPPA